MREITYSNTDSLVTSKMRICYICTEERNQINPKLIEGSETS